MAELTSYSAKNYRLIVGAHLVTGVVTDDFITVTPQGDGTTSESGAYGDVVRSISHDSRVQVALTLQHGSASSQALAALFKRDQVTQGGGTVPVSLVNVATGQDVLAGEGWVMNNPEAAFGATAGTRQWTLEVVGDYYPE